MRLIGFPDAWVETSFDRFDIRPAEEMPRLDIHEDVFVLPGMDALYTREGARIETSKRVTVPRDMRAAAQAGARIEANYGRHCPPSVSVPVGYDLIDRDIVYGGLSWPHYGHFITDGMSRLWALEMVAPDMPILFLDRADRDFGAKPYSRIVVEALGIADRLFSVERPTLIRRILIPEAAIQHAFRIYHAHARPHRATAKVVLAGRESLFKGKPVYLSRSALTGDLRKSDAEFALEERLRKMDFRIVYPETMTMADQIDMVNNSPLIAGMIGSAFHTELFSSRGAELRMIVLCWNKINHRYPMIDGISGSVVDYACTSAIREINEKNQRITTVDLDVETSADVIESALAEV